MTRINGKRNLKRVTRVLDERMGGDWVLWDQNLGPGAGATGSGSVKGKDMEE